MPFKRSTSPFWYVSFQDATGNRRNVATDLPATKENLPAAKQLESDLRHEAKKNKRRGLSPSIDFDTAALHWLQHTDRKDQERPKHALKHLQPVFTGEDITEITPQSVTAYREKRREEGATNGTINRELTVFQSILNYAERRFGAQTKNPVKGNKLKEPPGRIRWLTREEYNRLLKAADAAEQCPYLRAFIILCTQTGMRKQEALSLEWSRVDFANRLVYLYPENQKNAKTDSIPLNSAAISALQSLKNPTPLVFQREGDAVANIKRAFKSAAEKAGLPGVTPHTLRHTTASWLVQAGISLAEVKNFMRHADIRTTLRYAHLQPSGKARSAGVLEG